MRILGLRLRRNRRDQDDHEIKSIFLSLVVMQVELGPRVGVMMMFDLLW